MKKTFLAFSLMCAATVSASGIPFLLRLEIFNCKPGQYTVNAYPLPIAGRQCSGQEIRWNIRPRLNHTILTNGSISISNPPSGAYEIVASSEGVGCAGFVNLLVN